MRFSMYLNAESSEPEYDLDVIDALTAQAVYADQHGFAAVCLTEHDFNIYGNPFTFGAYLAPQLHNAYLVLSAAVPARWHPLRFAEACNALDLLTRGRCVIGVGSGAGSGDAAMEEAIKVAEQAMAKTLDDPDLEYAGGVLSHRIMPTSFTKPRPRFGRAALSDEGIVSAARHGWALITAGDAAAETGRKWALYNSALNRAEHDITTLTFARQWSMVQKAVYVGDSDEEAIGEISGPTDSMVLGSPDTVAQAIEDHQAEGIEHLALTFLHGRLDPALASRSLRRFVDEVMPRFTDPISTAENLAVSALSQS